MGFAAHVAARHQDTPITTPPAGYRSLMCALRAASFGVNSVFKGWQEAFLAIQPGAKWQLFVPPELGYGCNSPPAVPPGSQH